LDFFNFSLRGTKIHPKKPAFDGTQPEVAGEIAGRCHILRTLHILV
jgi:hypothetical protein